MSFSLHPITECIHNLKTLSNYDPVRGFPSVYLCTCGRRWDHVPDNTSSNHYVLVTGDEEETATYDRLRASSFLKNSHSHIAQAYAYLDDPANSPERHRRAIRETLDAVDWLRRALEIMDAKVRCNHPLGTSEALYVTCALDAGHDGPHQAIPSAKDKEHGR